MMNIFLGYPIEYFSANFDVGSDITIPKTMITLKKYLFCESVLNNIPLNYFQKVFITSCKTGATQTNDNLASMIH